MDWRPHIVSDPGILMGKPSIKGTRISVELILVGFANGWSMDELLEAYPHITKSDVLAALGYARHVVTARQIIDGLPGQALSPSATLHFEVTEAPEGGYLATAAEAAIYTEAANLDSLLPQVLDAVKCHYEGEHLPAIELLMGGKPIAAYPGTTTESDAQVVISALPNTPGDDSGSQRRR